MVAVAHPYGTFAVEKKPVKERSGLTQSMQIGVSEFTFSGRYNLAAKVTTHQLHTVAYAQHRNTQLKQFLGNRRGSFFIHRFRPAGENNSAWIKSTDSINAHIKCTQFTKDMSLAHPPGNKLGILGTEIQDQDFFTMNIIH